MSSVMFFLAVSSLLSTAPGQIGVAGSDSESNNSKLDHITALDGHCNQSKVLSALFNATIEMLVFDNNRVVVKKIRFCSNSILYQHFTQLLCKYEQYRVIDEDDVDSICQKFGISCISKNNGGSKPCNDSNDREYILASISDSCNLTKRCLKRVDSFTVDFVKLNLNSSNKSGLQNTDMIYSGQLYLLSTLFCHLYNGNRTEYQTNNTPPLVGSKPSTADGGLIIGLVIGVIVVAIILLGVFVYKKRRGNSRGIPQLLLTPKSK